MLQDNIILKKVIVHVSQPSIGKYKASEECIDLGTDFTEFLKKQIEKMTESDDAVKIDLNHAAITINLDNFEKNTAKLGEELYDICCDSVKIPDADLVFLTFTSEGTDYFGMLKMDYKPFYGHQKGSTEVVTKQVMTNTCKEAFIVNIDTLKGVLQQKKYEMLSGEKIFYLSEMFLKITTGLSPKKSFGYMMQAILKATKEKKLEDQLNIRLQLWNMYQDDGKFGIPTVSDQIFRDDTSGKTIFDDLMEKKDLSYESFEIKKEATVKKLEYQTIILDEIEIKVPISEILKVKEKYLPDGNQMVVDFEDRKLKS